MATLMNDLLELHWKLLERRVPGADVNALLLEDVYEVLTRHFTELSAREIAEEDARVAARNLALEEVCAMLQEMAQKQGTMGRTFAVCDCHDAVSKMLEEK